MANFRLVFDDYVSEDITAEIKISELPTKTTNEYVIDIIVESDNECICFTMDKSTAIKFAKTLRTEINKITESEGGNG